MRIPFDFDATLRIETRTLDSRSFAAMRGVWPLVKARAFG